MTDRKSYYVASAWAFECGRYAIRADALLGGNPDHLARADANATTYLGMLADALGLVVLSKADHVAMTGLLEELRDFRPTIHRSYHPDPQDREDDLMPLGEFQMFQDDAETLIGKKVKL